MGGFRSLVIMSSKQKLFNWGWNSKRQKTSVQFPLRQLLYKYFFLLSAKFIGDDLDFFLKTNDGFSQLFGLKGKTLLLNFSPKIN